MNQSSSILTDTSVALSVLMSLYGINILWDGLTSTLIRHQLFRLYHLLVCIEWIVNDALDPILCSFR